MVAGTLMQAERLDASEGEVKLAEGDTSSAIRLLRQALPGLMNDVTFRPTQMFRAAETLADALVKSGQTAEAIQVLEGVLAQRYRLTFSGAPLWSARCAAKLQELRR